MPVYLIIAEVRIVDAGFSAVWFILKCLACNLEDIGPLYTQHVFPLQATGKTIQTLVVYREPDNPFETGAVF